MRVSDDKSVGKNDRFRQMGQVVILVTQTMPEDAVLHAKGLGIAVNRSFAIAATWCDISALFLGVRISHSPGYSHIVSRVSSQLPGC